MIEIVFPEPTDPDWQEWCQECKNATQVVVQQVEDGQKPTITDLYKDDRMKQVYKSADGPFHGKCAYCESNVLVDQPGDIEHYRPKGRVVDRSGKPIRMNAPDNGASIPHPGYYWLAYEWRNLLLACVDCNRPSSYKTEGRGIGKRDCFPVVAFRAIHPGEEEQEEPMLINPMHEDPEDHLEVDELGIVIPKTARGSACIDIFGLNVRTALVDARRECIANTIDQISLGSLAASHCQEDELSRRLVTLGRIRTGEAPFAAAGRMALRASRERLQRYVEEL